MSARLEISSSMAPSENTSLSGSRVPRVEDLNTVNDFGINFYDPRIRYEDLHRGGGKVMIYTGETPQVYDVKGRKPILDNEGRLQGMEWRVKEISESEEEEDDEFQEFTIKGRKDPILYQYAATQGDEVFLLEQDVAQIIVLPEKTEYSQAAAAD